MRRITEFITGITPPAGAGILVGFGVYYLSSNMDAAIFLGGAAFSAMLTISSSIRSIRTYSQDTYNFNHLPHPDKLPQPDEED